jgi:cell wall-associated NlpC family hydrolase
MLAQYGPSVPGGLTLTDVDTTTDLAEAARQVSALFADTRVQHCRLGVAAEDGQRCTLTGAVLDHATKDRVKQELAARLRGSNVDVSGVEVLRAHSRAATVGTNLTGLYAQPSFLAEQISQLLYGWPLEVLQAEGNWRYVRQSDGYLGWAYAAYLADPAGCTFTHLVCAPETLVRTEPDQAAPLTTRLLGGTAVAVDAAEGDWCHVDLAGQHAGWLHQSAVRSFHLLPDTSAARREQLVSDAMRFVGVQYLWGGCSAWGIDCSGFAQLMHRLSGVTLPRDADMQFDAGRSVEYPYQPGDLVFFADSTEPRRISHVAISLGGWDIIHSSRRINGVYRDNIQAVPGLRDSFVGGKTFVE